MGTDAKYDNEITQFVLLFPLHPPKKRTLYYKIYFRVHHGGISGELMVDNLKQIYD